MTTETKPATDEAMPAEDGLIAELREHGDTLFTPPAVRTMRRLIDRIDAERKRADEAEDRVEELEREAEKVAAEFEGDATQALGRLASEFDDTFHEWADREGGWTVDNAATAIMDGRADLLRRIDALAAKVAWRDRQVARLSEALKWITQWPDGEARSTLGHVRRYAATALARATAEFSDQSERGALAAQLAEARQQIAALREALSDLVSWFDGGPSEHGPWIITAGAYGADDAVKAARAALAQTEEPKR